MIRLFLDDAQHFGGQLFSAFAAAAPYIGKRHIDAIFLAGFGNHVQFSICIGIELIDSHHSRQTINPCDVLHMFEKVGQAFFQRFQVFLIQVSLGRAAVVLERADGGDNDAGIGF